MLSKFLRRCILALLGKELKDFLISNFSTGDIKLCRRQFVARDLRVGGACIRGSSVAVQTIYWLIQVADGRPNRDKHFSPHLDHC
jgi:hypothetical protein